MKSSTVLYASAILLIAPGFGWGAALAKVGRVFSVRPPSVAATASSLPVPHGSGAGLRAGPELMLVQPGAVAAMPASFYAHPADFGAASRHAGVHPRCAISP